jgi:hypothetical protein
MKEWGPSVRHLAMVLEGGGVWASTMRTIIRGMNVLSRSSHPTSVHESVASAARVLAPIVREVARVEVAEGAVTAMIDALRADRRGHAAGAAGR